MELGNVSEKYVLIPKTVFWTFLGGVVIAVVSAWIGLISGFAKIEKEIEVLKVRFEKDEKLITENTKKFEEIQATLFEIKIELVQKKDKKIVE